MIHSNAPAPAFNIGQPTPLYDLATGTIQFRQRDADAPNAADILRELFDAVCGESTDNTEPQEATR